MCERFYLINFSLVCFILNFTMVSRTYFVKRLCLRFVRYTNWSLATLSNI